MVRRRKVSITRQGVGEGIALTRDPFVCQLRFGFQQQVGQAPCHFEVDRFVASEVGLLKPRRGRGVVALRENTRLGRQIALHEVDPGTQDRADEFEQIDGSAKTEFFRDVMTPGAPPIRVATDAVERGVIAIEMSGDAECENVQAHA